ncbi:helix-turn-helix domain-containing protein [Pedobacter jeongneungensis]|uniref:helix-turn-helix domain-containing protein n=1 Tax=Pedobacter jeongneungensis TaxID=947309 RepID=UPI0039777B53
MRARRSEYGFSQENMAKLLGISQNVYSKNERDIQNVPLGRVFRIAEILEMSISQLLEH